MIIKLEKLTGGVCIYPHNSISFDKRTDFVKRQYIYNEVYSYNYHPNTLL